MTFVHSFMASFRSKILKIVNSRGYDIYRTNWFDEHSELIKLVEPYTMTSRSSVVALLEAVKYVVKNDVEGSIVECGVWKGGSMMAVAKILLDMNISNRDLYLFDTYEGMIKPTDKDVGIKENLDAAKIFEREKTGEDTSNWVRATLEEVKKAVYSIGYDKDKIHFIKGKVEKTLPEHSIKSISILRLDTDWYESTKHELVHLFPLLSHGGVLIIDDYDAWHGARKAVDEYILQNKVPILLNKIPSGGRIGIKI